MHGKQTKNKRKSTKAGKLRRKLAKQSELGKPKRLKLQLQRLQHVKPSVPPSGGIFPPPKKDTQRLALLQLRRCERRDPGPEASPEARSEGQRRRRRHRLGTRLWQ